MAMGSLHMESLGENLNFCVRSTLLRGCNTRSEKVRTLAGQSMGNINLDIIEPGQHKTLAT